MKKIVFFLLMSYWAYGQSAQELRNTFNQGKKLFQEADYRAAMNSLEGFANSSSRNDLQLYGNYFYALSAYEYKDYSKAAQNFQKIIQNYPNWQQKDEAYFLLASSQFELGEWENAYQTCQKTQLNEQAESLSHLKKHYFMLMPLDELSKIAQKNPSDGLLSEVLLVRKAIKDPKSEAVQQVIEKMDIKIPKITTKKKYKVAVLFPFDIGSISTSTNQRSNQFVLDMYEGIRIAQQELDSIGFKIDLLAYDTEQSTAHLRGILKNKKFQDVDFIIGPLYLNVTPLAMDFAEKNQILNVQPLSNNHELLKNNFTYLLQPSFRTQAQKAAQFALDSFPEKQALIFYGSTPKDSVLAWEYKNYFEKNGGKIVSFRKFAKNSTAGLISDIGKASSKSHIFVSSDQEVLGVNILNISRANRKFLPIITTESWLNFPAMSLEQFDTEPIYFLMPDFIEPSNPFLQDFRKKYYQKTNIIPSRYAYLGYESLLYFGKKIRSFGGNFYEKIQKTPFEKGNLLFGVEYGQNRDNQVVPICRFLEGELTPVNYLPPQEEEDK